MAENINEEVWEEDVHPRGALPDKIDIRDYYLPAAKSDNKVFPEEFELEMPPVKDQGRVGSCVAHALSTIIEYYNKLQEGTDVEFSVGYIYGNRTESDKNIKGMYVTHALDRLSKFGDVKQEQFPYNQEIPTILSTFNKYAFELSPDAIPNRISSYFTIYFPSGVKEALMTYGPVIMTANWTGREKLDADGVVIMDPDYITRASGHCTIIYGWKGNNWLVQNSWGTKWGNGGRCLLPMNSPMLTGYRGVIDEVSETLRAQKISDLENKINSLKEQLAEDKNVLNTLEDLLVEKEDEIRTVKNQLAENEVNIQQLEFYQTDNKNLQDRIQILNELLETNKQKLENLTTEDQELINNLNFQIEQLNIELEQTQTQLDTCNKAYEDLINSKDAEVQKLIELYNSLKEEHKQLENQSDLYEQEIDNLRKTNDGLRDQIKELEDQKLNIEKPYKNWPTWLVKVVNFFVNLFHKEK